jgi:ATP-dependent exoDNAse (exonuclease V) beta subunit
LESDIITGHIDFLQIRNGYIHLLDYKSAARKETHAHVQLTIYALALGRRAGLPLKAFKCDWFDEKDYFEFFPLTEVYMPTFKNEVQSLTSK